MAEVTSDNIEVMMAEAAIGSHLDEIKAMFKAEAGTRVLLVVDNTNVPDSQIVIGDLDAKRAIDLINNFEEHAAPKGGA